MLDRTVLGIEHRSRDHQERRASVNRVSAELRKVVDDPAVRDRLSPMGFETRSSSPAQVADTVKVDLALWKQIVKDAGIEPQ